jgi:hypothetical protein
MDHDLEVFAATEDEILLDEAELDTQLDVESPSPMIVENINEA